MVKPQGRKPPRRKPTRTKIDAELAELASVLDENYLESDLDGWFTLPWRNGWNAIRLALSDFEWLSRNRHGAPLAIPATLRHRVVTLTKWCISEELWTGAHAEAEAIQAEAISEWFTTSEAAYVSLAAAARCLQLQVANSSGGGHVFNILLRRAFEGRDREGEGQGLSDVYSLEARIMAHRRADAVGELKPDGSNARQIGAFDIAWRRGLYHAAYSIKGA